MAGNQDSHNGNHGVRPLLCSFIKKESTIEDDATGSMQSIDSSGIAYTALTKDYLKSESSFKCENVMEIEDTGLGLVDDLYFESSNEPIPGQSLLQRNRKDVITDHPPISVKLEATANFNQDPYGLTETSQPKSSLKQMHTYNSVFCTPNEKTSSFNDDQSMNIIEEDSELHRVNSKFPIIIKEELIEVDECSDDSKNHRSSNIALKMEWGEISDFLTHSPRTNQSEHSYCVNESNLTTLTTNCKEELDLEDVQSIMFKEESHNVVEIDMKLEGSMRDNITKYTQLDNVMNCDSTCDNEKQQYMCHSCPRKFSTRQSFIDHLISHHAKFVVYKCPTCELTFAPKAVQSEHSGDCKSKSQVNEPNCPLVAMQFISKSVVKVNKAKAQGQLLTCAYRCAICKKVFKAEISLRNHLEASLRDNITKKSKLDNVINCDSTCDNEKQQYMCHTCRQKFPTLRCLIDHLISDHAKCIVYKCVTCELSFISKAAFSEHSADCHSKFQVNEPNFPLVAMQCTSNNLVKVKNTKTQGYLLTLAYGCSICSSIFRTEISLRNHLEEAVSCKKCLKLFCSPTELQIHNKVHDSDISLECLTCNKKFKHKISFRCHTSRKVTCDKCAESFCFKLDLLKHQKTCNLTYEYPSKYSYGKSVGLKKAENRSKVHNLGKLDCMICRKKFDSEQNLTMHINRKQRTCGRPTCGERFCDNISFGKHKEKCWPSFADLFSCNLCSKTFSTSEKLINHMADHSFSCGLCPRKFVTSSSLLNHNKRDHKESTQ